MHLLIPAAGVGKRMGGDRNKLLLPLLDRSILAWTLRAAAQSQSIEWVGLIGQPVDEPDFQAILAELQLPLPVQWVQGGDTRQASVKNGLRALPETAKQVLIHDGARCLATPGLFDRCSEALKTCEGLIAAVPVKDTIKQVGDGGLILATPDRSQLWAAQTPQGFAVAPLKQAHQQAIERGWVVTDDAALFEQCGLPVAIVEGEETNLKITTPVDLAIATFILQNRLKTP
ncbi:MAG: 2-C-methyl-D-erythritol 4-phosphate cytidylyltransferase [Cyanobacteria bacterium P01_A01_bin.105]